jgi:hypothetical protein
VGQPRGCADREGSRCLIFRRPVARASAAALGLLAGVAALAAASLSGAAGDVFGSVATPPAIVRAALVAAAAVLGAWLLREALRRMAAARDRPPLAAMSGAELASMLRGIRFVFLAAAACSAAIGWLIGSPLPIVVGLVIAGVDVLETSVLLLVATRSS